MKKTLLLSLFLSFFSCNKEILPQPPEDIFNNYKSSVVLIATQFYYEIYSNGSLYYYSPNSKDKLYFSKEAVLNNLSFSTGSGFIISNKGEIITNNHVVNHKDENYKTELKILYDIFKASAKYDIQKYNDTIESIQQTYSLYSEVMGNYEKEGLENRYSLAKKNKNEMELLYEKFNTIDFDNASSKLIIHKLGIAFNDTHITEIDDLQECVVIKLSNNENIDLALIQTKTKTLNKTPKFILNFKDNNPNLIENSANTKERDLKNPIKVNDDVFMIGYNKGFSLANTKQGIKSQFTSGKISQESDGERILYTIPTLEGSSGSPIIDKWGNLVGVNFAKISNSQSFSFGVPVNQVKKFYEE